MLNLNKAPEQEDKERVLDLHLTKKGVYTYSAKTRNPSLQAGKQATWNTDEYLLLQTDIHGTRYKDWENTQTLGVGVGVGGRDGLG